MPVSSSIIASLLGSRDRTVVIAVVAVVAVVTVAVVASLVIRSRRKTKESFASKVPGVTTYTLRKRLALKAPSPMGIAITPNQEFLFVGTSTLIEIYRVSDLSFVFSYIHNLLGSPCLTFSADGSRLAAGGNGNFVMFLTDISKLRSNDINVQAAALKRVWMYTTTPPATNSSFFSAFSPDGRTLVAANEHGDNMVYVFDVVSGKLKGKIDTGRGSTVGIVFLSPTMIAYAKESDDAYKKSGQGSVQAADLTTMRRGRSVAVGIQPVRIVRPPGSPYVYVSVRGPEKAPYDSQVAIVSASYLLTGTGTGLIKKIGGVGPSAVGLAVIHIKGKPYIMVSASNRWVKKSKGAILIVDPQSGTIVKSIPGGGFPRDILISRSGTVAYVANNQGQSVDVIQLNALV